MSKRDDAIKHMEKHLYMLSPKNKSIPIMIDYLRGVSEKEFARLMDAALNDEWAVSIECPNMSDQEIELDNALDTAEKLGIELMHHLVIVDPDTGEEITTPKRYLVGKTIVRRLIQSLEKKKALPDNTKRVDHLTGQVTGDSKGSTLSSPEIGILDSKGFESAIVELIKVRGGDETAYRAMNTAMNAQGQYSIAAIEELGSKPKVVELYAAILFAMHYDNNMSKG